MPTPGSGVSFTPAQNADTTPALAKGTDTTVPANLKDLPADQQSSAKGSITFNKQGQATTPAAAFATENAGDNASKQTPGPYGGLLGIDSDAQGKVKNGQHYFAGGTYQQQQEQMDQINQLLTSGQYRSVPPNVMSDYLSGNASLEETITAITGSTEYNPSMGPQIDTGNGPQQSGIARNADGSIDWNSINFGSLSKEDAQSLLDSGSDPANNPDNQPTEQSSGAQVTAAANAAISGGATTPGGTGSSSGATGSSGGNTGANAGGVTPAGNPIPANVPGLPFGNLGSEPTFDASSYKEGLLQTMGVDEMTSQVQSIDGSIVGLKQQLAQQEAQIQSQPISTRVMGGQIKQAKALLTNQINAMTAQKTLLNARIAQQNKAITLIMSQQNKDYTAAKAQWTKENNDNMAYINKFDAGTTLQQKQDKSALTTMLKNLKDTPFGSLSQDQQTQISQLVNSVYGSQFQGIWDAGLDFSATIYTGTYKGSDGATYLQKLDLNPDGSISTQYVSQQAPSTMTTTQKTEYQNKADSYFKGEVDQSTGFVNGADYQQLRQSYVDAGGDGHSFDSTNGHYLSPSDKLKYGISVSATASSGGGITIPTQ